MPYDPREATIASTQHALYTSQTDCTSIVSSFLARIETLNKHTNAIVSLNPNALAEAASLDKALADGTATKGPLFGIPILLKDNFNTAEMATTGSNLALAHSQPTIDAPSVAALKKAGAIILGKANLHDLAMEGLSVSSLGGQTINPYDSTRTPGGSSGGSAAAVAASFCVWATGSDTVNSLRSPASANSLFSCRPTRGLISRAGIIPNSHTQDAIGPIARCVQDVATALTVMAGVGVDAEDEATALVPEGVREVDYTKALAGASLRGLRLGLVEGFFDRTESAETTPVNDVMAAMVETLQSAGATIVPITEPFYDSASIFERLDVQRYEHRQEFDAYLQQPTLQGQHPQTLESVYTESAGKFLVIPAQYAHVRRVLAGSTQDAGYATARQGIQILTQAVEETFATNVLDAMIYPEQKNLVVKIGSPIQQGRNGIMAAVTGLPVVTVPAGFSQRSAEAPIGVPIGMEILGRSWSEAKLLQIAYQIQELCKIRKCPAWAGQEIPARIYSEIPSVTPDSGNLSSNYPLGVL